jgi:uncharacterized protein with PIN domain
VLVDGRSVDFTHRLRGGERVAVYPAFERLDISPLLRLRPRPLRETRFVLDVHLGRLARHLRLLGLDCAYRQDWDDTTLIDRALAERRIILTRDVGILKQGRVTHGYWVRSDQPARQLEEIIEAFDLRRQLAPFTRCLECNGVIGPVDRTELAGEVRRNPCVSAVLAVRECLRVLQGRTTGAVGACGGFSPNFPEGAGPDAPATERTAVAGSGNAELAAYPHAARGIQVVETHISWVILTGDFAYKIKKPVDLGFLDFSTLELRRHYCEEELRVNRRTAGEWYLDVVPIGVRDGGLRVGLEPAVEYAVRMRQFPHDARLDRCLQDGRLGTAEMRLLAETIARFHAALPPRRDIDPRYEIDRASRPARNNFIHLDPAAFDDATQQRLAVIEAWTLQQAEALAPEFARRAREGAVRECHGDLHLGNLLCMTVASCRSTPSSST